MKDERDTRRGAYLEISPRIDGGHGKGQQDERKDGGELDGGLALPRLDHTTPNTRDIVLRPPCPLKTRTTTTS